MAADEVAIEDYVSHLKSWLQNCNEHHDDECQVDPIAERPPHHIPDWVIDTEDACIVRGSSVPRYVALSYVWNPLPGGRHTCSRLARALPEYAGSQKAVGDRLMLLKDNLADFCTKGFLHTNVLDRVPAVVRDAINLVQRSGARYLWVDCLCIVQYAETTKERVNTMNEIYSGAYFTIVAAAKSAEGLYGSRCLGEAYIRNGKPSAASLHAELLCSHWASRGWTFQEQLLSNRAMVFLDDMYFWDCQREVQCPGVAAASETASQDPPATRGIGQEKSQRRREKPPSIPDLKLYVELVCRYNNRQLTYDQDALPAFSGVLDALSQWGFFGGFVCGLPALLLDSALLWQPLTKARRRVAMESAARLAPKAPLPSWSWVGWQCRVDPDSLLCDMIQGSEPGHGTRKLPSCTVTKLVDWSTFPDGNPIDETGLMQEYKATGRSHDFRNLPPNWSYRPSYDDPVTLRSYPESFVHETMPDIFHRYPLPVQEAKPARNSPFISCTARRARFRARRVLVPYTPKLVGWELRGPTGTKRMGATSIKAVSVISTKIYASPPHNETCPVVTLEDGGGRWAGTLQLMEASVDARPGSDLELIAISTGSVPYSDGDRSFQEGIDGTGTWTYTWFDRERPRQKKYYFQPLDSPDFPDKLAPSTLIPSLPPESKPFLDETRRNIEAGIDVGPFARRWVTMVDEGKGTSAGGEGPETTDEPKRCYQFYNVLWVEIIDGIIRRWDEPG
ncbi:HET-domain-containing protein [Apiospora saccharicola]|uniref:HET-domain-containing protein n=1 Tax=Apiospora saccharicola TaxID=335842 RepID=A0ABR1UE44_9PEZI